MKKDLVQIVIILDKSGSMSSLKSDIIGGFNQFIKSQRDVLSDKEVVVSLILFDSQYQKIIDRCNLLDIKQLDQKTYVPQGSTALLDTIGITIDTLGGILSQTEEDERPQKIIIAIITDGQQNASNVYTNIKIHEMISHQTQVYNWQFIFLSSDLKAIKDANKLYGISDLNTDFFIPCSSGYNMMDHDSSYSKMSRTIRARVDGNKTSIENLPGLQQAETKSQTT